MRLTAFISLPALRRLFRSPRSLRCAGVRALSLTCALAGCSAAVEPSYNDPTPDARIGAARTSAATMNRSDAPRLVESLSSDDPAVRLASIEALRRITGSTLGYRASAPPPDRLEAIERWKAWVREQGLVPTSPPPATATIAPDSGSSTTGATVPAASPPAAPAATTPPSIAPNSAANTPKPRSG